MSSNSSLPNGFPQPPSGAGAPEGILTRPVLRASPGARLLLVRDDGAPATVRVRPCFPWSEPHRHFSLRDGEDRELALVDDPAALDPASRQALEDALAQAGFVFRVKRVVDIEEEIEIRHWTVDTEQGSRRFQDAPGRLAARVAGRRPPGA